MLPDLRLAAEVNNFHMDRRCTVTRDGTTVWQGPCRMSQSAELVGGGDPEGANAHTVVTTTFVLPMAATGLVRLGDLIKHDEIEPIHVGGVLDGQTNQAAVRVIATEQAVATPWVTITLSRRVAGAWTTLLPQAFRLTLEAASLDPLSSVLWQDGTLVGDDAADVRQDDRFQFEGKWAIVGVVHRPTNRVEARFRRNLGG